MVELHSDDLADAVALLAAIERELSGIVTSSGSGDWFVFYDPERVTVPEQRFPFVTVITGDHVYDTVSHLDRDARTYRVNLGIGRARYEQLLGLAPREPAGNAVIDTGVDYTDVDTVMPHPLYAPMHWVCLVNPRAGTTVTKDYTCHRSPSSRRRRVSRPSAFRAALASVPPASWCRPCRRQSTVSCSRFKPMACSRYAVGLRPVRRVRRLGR